MNTIYLIASGDLRASANQKCESEQLKMEQSLIAAVEKLNGKSSAPTAFARRSGTVSSIPRNLGWRSSQISPPKRR